MTTTSRSIIELHITTLLWSVTPLFAKWIPLPAHTIVCIRSLITAFVLALFVWTVRGTLRIPARSGQGLMAILGIIMCFHWVTLFIGFQSAPISVAIIAFFTFPVMSSFIEPLWFGETWSVREIVSSLLILTGIYFIVPEFSLENEVTVGVMWGILSALLFTFRNILIRKYAGEYQSSVVMFYQMLITGVLILPFISTQIQVIDSSSWWKFLFMSVVFTAIPHTLLARSLKTIKASTVGVIISLQPLYSTLLAAWFLNEIPGMFVWLGGTLVAGAVILETMKQRSASS